MHSPHSPKIIALRDGGWIVECLACRNDRMSEVPIGIGMRLQDRLTAERLAENHRRGQGPQVAEAQAAARSVYLGHPGTPAVAEARSKAASSEGSARQQTARARSHRQRSEQRVRTA